MKRRGFALLSAILIAAFMLAIVTGIGATLASQVRSQAQAGVSKKAFYYAEAALQKSFSDACNSADTGIRPRLLGNPEPPHPVPPQAWPGQPGQIPADIRAFTWVKAKPVFDSGNNLLRYEFIAEGVVCDRDVSTLSSDELRAGTVFNVLARRVITLAASGLSVSKQGSVFDYGLFAGLNITQNGNSDYREGTPGIDIYSNGNISMNGGTTLYGIDVYAHGTVDVTVVEGSSQAHSRELTVAPIDLAYWQDQFVAFLKGTAPYDGTILLGDTVPRYMDTSDAKVRTAIGNYLIGKVGGSGEPSEYFYTTPGEVAALWAALSSSTQPGSGPFSLSGGGISAAQYTQLHSTFLTTVFYVQDSAGSLNATIPDSNVGGVLVCPGTLAFTAKRDVGSGAVFICKGDLTFDGSGYLTGTFYTDGNAYTKNGSTTALYGSIIAPSGSITFNGRNGNATLVNFAVANPDLGEQFQAIEAMSSGWSEADYGAFTAF